MATVHELTPVATPNPFKGGHYRLEDGKDIVAWTNKSLPKNLRVLVPLLLGAGFFIPIVLMLTAQLWRESRVLARVGAEDTTGFGIALVIALVCWAIVVYIGHHLLQLSWTETLTIDNETIAFTYSGLLAPKPKSASIDDIWKLSFERYKLNQDSEQNHSFNIVHKRREHVGLWMRPQETLELYRVVSTALQRREVAALIQFIENDERHPGMRNTSGRR